MKSLYSKLSIIKTEEDFFSNYKKNTTIKQIEKDLNLTIDEAAIFCIIISYQLENNYSTSFSDLKKDFNLESDDYLKYLNIAVGTQRIWPPRALTLGHLTHNDLATVRISK